MHCEDVLDRLDEVLDEKLLDVVKAAILMGSIDPDDSMCYPIVADLFVTALDTLEERDACDCSCHTECVCDCEDVDVEDLCDEEEELPPPRDPVLVEVSDMLGVDVESLQETQLAIQLEGRCSQDTDMILNMLEGKTDLNLGLVRVTLEVM